MQTNKFNLDMQVMITANKRPGTVVGVATYTYIPPQYWISFINGVGDSVKEWFDETELS